MIGDIPTFSLWYLRHTTRHMHVTSGGISSQQINEDYIATVNIEIVDSARCLFWVTYIWSVDAIYQITKKYYINVFILLNVNISIYTVKPLNIRRLSALLQLHLHSRLNIWLQWIRQRQPQDNTRILWELGFSASYISDLTVCIIFMIVTAKRAAHLKPRIAWGNIVSLFCINLPGYCCISLTFFCKLFSKERKTCLFFVVS